MLGSAGHCAGGVGGRQRAGALEQRDERRAEFTIGECGRVAPRHYHVRAAGEFGAQLAELFAQVALDPVAAHGAGVDLARHRQAQARRRTSTPELSLHWLRDGAPPRLGLAVSRKVDTRAVGRNRIKRSLREQFRHCSGALAPGAYVVVARKPAATMPNAQLRAVFDALLRRAGALPPPEPTGTMPG